MDVAIKNETNLTPQPQRNPQGNAPNAKQLPPPPPPPPAQQNASAGDGGDGNQQQGPTPLMDIDQKPFGNQGQGNRKIFDGNQHGANRQGMGMNNRGGRGGGGGGGGRFGGRGGGGGGRQNNFQQNRRQNQDGNEGMNSGGNNQRGGGGGVGNDNRGDRMHQKGRNMRNGGGGEDFLINQKLSNLQGPTHDIPTIKHEEVKFSGRNRLYIGNLTNDINEEEIKQLFEPFGEISEVFLNAEKFFAFVKVDYRVNAEKAKRELDGFMRKNRPLRVRFAPNATTIRVKNLTPFVSNELLYKSFEIFGQIEKAVIIVDDRGKPIGEGIVEFTRKSGAMAAMRYCAEKCFFLTSSLRPCVCEVFEHSDDTDGYPEKSINKKIQDFYQARTMGPRFAEFNSFEHEYGTRWKQLHELYKQKHEALKNEMLREEEKLEAQMEYARYEHETEMLRDQLRMREQDRDLRKSNWELKEKYADEQRQKAEEQMRRTQEEMSLRMGKQEDDLRRRQQENSLFIQAQQLNSLLDAQEVDTPADGPNDNNSGGNIRKLFDVPSRNFQGGMGGGNQDSIMDFGGQNNRGNQGNMGGNRGGGQRGQWNNNNQQNDGGFQNKRRRF